MRYDSNITFFSRDVIRLLLIWREKLLFGYVLLFENLFIRRGEVRGRVASLDEINYTRAFPRYYLNYIHVQLYDEILEMKFYCLDGNN